MRIFLNRNLLIKALGFDLNTVEIIDRLSPLRFSSEGSQMIVMPIRIEFSAHAVPTSQTAEVHGEDEVQTVNSPVPEPAAPSYAAPKETKPVINNTAEQPASAPTVDSRIEIALELIDTLRESFQKGLTGPKDVSTKLRGCYELFAFEDVNLA